MVPHLYAGIWRVACEVKQQVLCFAKVGMKQKMKVFTTIFLAALLAACSGAIPGPFDTATTTPTFITFTPSPIPTKTPLPTGIPTSTSEPAISPGCTIVNERGQLFVLSDKEFSDLWSHERVIDQALARYYPEWGNYRQMVSWSTEPVKLSEILTSASFDNELNLQINSTVALVALGMSLDWQLPVHSDLFLKSREISLKLNDLALEWERPGNEQIHMSFANISNAATYALYIYFDSNQEKLREFCTTYQRLFITIP
jgi:hypothetical protein